MKIFLRKLIAVLAMLGVVGLNTVPLIAFAQDKPAAGKKADDKMAAPAKEEKKEEAKPATPQIGRAHV